jgi:hypothetical protein
MRIFLIILACSQILPIFSQEVLNFPGRNLNFEDTSEYQYILIDTNKIWHIAKPDKKILFLPDNHPYLGEYAIISDTNDYYQENINSSFQFKLKFIGGWNGYSIQFSHKYDFEKNKDGGIIETSYDNGLNWQNIIYDTIIFNNIDHISGLYNDYDTISSFDNLPGFTGIQSGITRVTMSFWCSEIVFHEIDTMLLRFKIATDSVNSNNEGWMIDDIVFGAFLVGINDNNNDNISLFPNPSKNVLSISSTNELVQKIEIFTLNGIKVIEKYDAHTLIIKKLRPGIYIVRINEKIIKKLVIK